MDNQNKNQGIYNEDQNKEKENIKKKPEKITDPLEDEAQQDESSSRDLDTPQKSKEPKK